MQTTVARVQRDHASSSRASLVRGTPRTEDPRSRRTSFYDVVIVVCFLALIGIAALGGVVMLLSWVTTSFPAAPRGTCPELEGCAQHQPDEDHGLPVDDQRTDGPTLTR
jgi:hypothetical protein